MGIKLDPKSRIVLIRISGLNRVLPREIRKSLYFIGKKLKGTASKNILKRGRLGRSYRYRGRRHRASVKGESWANRSGAARRGLVYNVSGSKRLIFGNTVEHAKFLEFGTKNMAPRPAHLISIKQNNRNIVKSLNRSVKKTFDS